MLSFDFVPPAAANVAPILLGCAVFSAALMAVLVLFFSLKREIDGIALRQQRGLAEIATRIAESQEWALPAAGSEAEAGERMNVGLHPQFHSGFNLNKRVQAIRMLRRGEDEAHIAAALQVPSKEVDLLMRIQKLTAQPFSPSRKAVSALPYKLPQKITSKARSQHALPTLLA